MLGRTPPGFRRPRPRGPSRRTGGIARDRRPWAAAPWACVWTCGPLQWRCSAQLPVLGGAGRHRLRGGRPRTGASKTAGTGCSTWASTRIACEIARTMGRKTSRYRGNWPSTSCAPPGQTSPSGESESAPDSPTPSPRPSSAKSDRPGGVGRALVAWGAARYMPRPCRSVAQPGRALCSGRRGRRFESSHSDHGPSPSDAPAARRRTRIWI